jgi:hypothetical protein
VEYLVASNHLKMQTLSERRENHCIYRLDCESTVSSPEHRLHDLLPDRVRDTRQSETRSNANMYYNFKFRICRKI